MFRNDTDGEGLAIGVLLLVLLFAIVAYRTPPTGPLQYYEVYVPRPTDRSALGFAVAQLEPDLWTRRARCAVNRSLQVVGETHRERCLWDARPGGPR